MQEEREEVALVNSKKKPNRLSGPAKLGIVPRLKPTEQPRDTRRLTLPYLFYITNAIL